MTAPAAAAFIFPTEQKMKGRSTHSLAPSLCARPQLDWEVCGPQAARPSNLKAFDSQKLRFSLVIDGVESDPVLLSPSGTATATEGPNRGRWPGLHGSTHSGEGQGFVFSRPSGCAGGGSLSSSAPIHKAPGAERCLETITSICVTSGQGYTVVPSAGGNPGHMDAPTSPTYMLAKQP